MGHTRHAAVAGTFYPRDPVVLEQSLKDLLDSAKKSATPGKSGHPKALIVPHAGYVYSGPVAAAAYQKLWPGALTIKRVVLLGPSHRIGFKGIAACTATSYQTPLGDINVDHTAITSILDCANTGFLDEAHQLEHSLEVHLPFLQHILEDFTIVPLVVGNADPEDVARILETLWGGPETLILISSDLSHYHPYNEANQRDLLTAKKITDLAGSLTGEEACGCRPLNGFLQLVKSRGQSIDEILVCNSGDTSGDRSRVVGYGAFELHEPQPVFSRAESQLLLQISRHAILHHLSNNQPFEIPPNVLTPRLAEIGAAFVTLQLDGQLRGCIGSLEAHRPLITDVARNAVAAAFNDPRFQPLNQAEYARLEVEISILSTPVPLGTRSRSDLLAEINPGIDGIIIEENGKRATFLPSVWEQLPDPAGFLDNLRRKAGLDPMLWQDCLVWRYHAEKLS